MVLELVEGPTLADRIGKGPIPVSEALPVAKQIAEALEAAHEAGVIHRDLKPAKLGHRRAWPVRTVLWQCAGCGRQTSVTAGTIFEGARAPLTTWFRAMLLVATVNFPFVATENRTL